MRSRRFRPILPVAALLLAGALLGLAACSTTAPQTEAAAAVDSEPDLRHRSTSRQLLSFTAAQLRFRFTLELPAAGRIAIKEYRYRLSAGEELLASGGGPAEELELAGSGSRSFELPVRVPLSPPREERSAAASSSATERTTARRAYRLSLTLTGSGPAGEPRELTASAEGELPAPQLPQIRLPQVIIPQFESTTIRVHYELTLRNPNPFPITVADLDYRFTSGAQHWDTRRLEGPIRIAPQSVAQRAVDLRINYLKAGREKVDILVGAKAMEYRLRGSAAVSTGEHSGASGKAFAFSFDTQERAAIIRP
jgi:LEA14-like dessication related protein